MVSVGRRKANRLCVCAVAASLCVGAGAFFAASPASTPRRTPLGATSRVMTRLNGVREWKEGQPGELREIGFLPFPVDDVMCPGETKALHLYEARFLSLFENAIKNHGGCVGGALFVDESVLIRVGQLCDIVAWEREEVGVSVALRCVGRCEIRDVTNVEPYISATVREVRDLAGMDDPDGEGEGNDVVSSDVFSLHRQCVELEGKMAATAGGNIGWEAGMGGKVSGRKNGASWDQSGPWTDDDDDDDDDSDSEDEYELFGESGSAAFDRTSGEGGAETDDLMARFQRGGGELDLSQLNGGGSGSPTGDGETPPSAAAAGGVVEDTSATGRWGESAIDGRRGSSIDSFAAEDDDDDDDEEEEDDDEEEEEGRREKGPEDLLWGHEKYESDGFDSSLEEQVEAMYDSLKADLSVSLEETRGGVDAAAFGAPSKNAGGDRPWGVSGGGGPTTIADVIAAAASAGGSLSPGGEEGAPGEGQYLWGCSSPQEEREQLVSYVSLGCFDPSARLQSLMLLSTGERLRMARDALAERLKVLVAKSALSQLGE